MVQFSPFRCAFLAAVLSIWVWSKEAQGEFSQKKWAFDLFFGCGKTQKAYVVYTYMILLDLRCEAKEEE